MVETFPEVAADGVVTRRTADGARRPTMKDVAALAGVSLSTVSRVVNGDPVQVDRARRVRRAVELLGYRRDLTASLLRRADRTSASLGLLVADVANPFFASVIRGVEQVTRAREVLAFVASSDEDPDRERELARALAARGVDGLIVVPTGTDHSYLLREREAGLALVFVDRPPGYLPADTALSDNAAAARSAVAHLTARGHRRIAFLGGPALLFTAAERFRGYQEDLAASGVPVDPTLVHRGLADSDAAAAATRALLTRPEPPTALVAGQNLLTVGAVRALRELGQQSRIALVGIDDVLLADVVDPGITVVAQQPVTLGRRAAELLFARLDGDDAPPRCVTVPTTLIPRGSGELPLPTP